MITTLHMRRRTNGSPIYCLGLSAAAIGLACLLLHLQPPPLLLLPPLLKPSPAAVWADAGVCPPGHTPLAPTQAHHPVPTRPRESCQRGWLQHYRNNVTLCSKAPSAARRLPDPSFRGRPGNSAPRSPTSRRAPKAMAPPSPCAPDPKRITVRFRAAPYSITLG
jgi:hypothetical protein